MEIHKGPASPSTLVVLPQQREAALRSEKFETRRVRPSDGPAEREVKVYAYDPEKFESLIRHLEGRRAAAEECRAQHDSAMLSNRAKQALNAYHWQQNQAQDEKHIVLQQMLGIDYYA